MGTCEAKKNGNSQGKNKGVKRRDRKMQRDRVRGRKREKTSGQWLCGLNLWCRMTTHTVLAHGQIHKEIQSMSLTLLLLRWNFESV